MARKILKINKEGEIIRGKKLPGGQFKDIAKLLKKLIEMGFVSVIEIETTSGTMEIYIWRNLTADEIRWLDKNYPEWKEFFPNGPSPIIHTPTCIYKKV